MRSLVARTEYPFGCRRESCVCQEQYWMSHQMLKKRTTVDTKLPQFGDSSWALFVIA